MEHQSNEASHNYADVIQDIKDIFQRRNDELNAVIKKLEAPTESDQVAEINIGTLKRNIVSPEAIHKYAEMIISTANAVGLKPSQIRDLPADIDNTIRNEPIAQPLASIIYKIEQDMHTELHQALRSGKTGEAEALIDRLLKEDPEQLKGKNYLQFAVDGQYVRGDSLEMSILFPRQSLEPRIHSPIGGYDPSAPRLGHTHRISNEHIGKLADLASTEELKNAYLSLTHAHTGREHMLSIELGKKLEARAPGAIAAMDEEQLRKRNNNPIFRLPSMRDELMKRFRKDPPQEGTGTGR